MEGKLKIGSIEKKLKDITPCWISEQINRRRENKEPVCVLAILKFDDVDISLGTCDCASGGGNRRRDFSKQEQGLIDLWSKCDLNKKSFSSESVCAFISELNL